jgi:hypothetical protein
MPARARDDDRDRPPGGAAPESGMGGASDIGAHGRHPASAPEMAREQRLADPEAVPGDAAIERRRRRDPAYSGPERRIAKR